MLSADELMRAYEEGDLTRSELFAHMLSLINPANIDTIMAKLSSEPGCSGEFEEWLADVARGAEVFAGKRMVPVPGAKAAAQTWRSRTPGSQGADDRGPRHGRGGTTERPRKAVTLVDVQFLSTLRTMPESRAWNDTDTYSRPTADRVVSDIKDVDVLASRSVGARRDGPQA